MNIIFPTEENDAPVMRPPQNPTEQLLYYDLTIRGMTGADIFEADEGCWPVLSDEQRTNMANAIWRCERPTTGIQPDALFAEMIVARVGNCSWAIAYEDGTSRRFAQVWVRPGEATEQTPDGREVLTSITYVWLVVVHETAFNAIARQAIAYEFSGDYPEAANLPEYQPDRKGMPIRKTRTWTLGDVTNEMREAGPWEIFLAGRWQAFDAVQHTTLDAAENDGLPARPIADAV